MPGLFSFLLLSRCHCCLRFYYYFLAVFLDFVFEVLLFWFVFSYHLIPIRWRTSPTSILYKKKKKKVREKSRECHNHKPQPFPDPKRKRKPTNPNKLKSNNVRKALTHGKTYNKSPRRINHKATKSKNNTGTTALERSVEQTTGGLKHFYS